MIRIAIVGAGTMGKEHAQSYRQIDDVRVAYIVDERSDAAKALAETSDAQVCGRISDIPQGSVDAVDICLPTFLHVQAILDAAKLCSYIVCEKPLSLHAEEVEAVRNIIEEKGIHLMIAQVVRFTESYALAQKMVADGKLGAIHSIIAQRKRSFPKTIVGGWLRNKTLGGGLVYDLAIHDLDYIAWLLGEPKQVYASGTQDSDGTDAHLYLNLTYENCSAVAFASWDMPEGYHNGTLGTSLEIVGERGRIYVDEDGKFFLDDDTAEHVIAYSDTNPYTEELKYFVQCCKNGEEPTFLNLSAVESTLRIAHACEVSIRENRVVGMYAGKEREERA